MKASNNKRELEQLAPQLKKLLDKERSEAALPKDYFQNFETRLQQRLATERSLEPATTPRSAHPLVEWWQRFWRPATALALPAFLLLLWWGLSPKEMLVEPTNFAQVSSQEIDQYMEQNIALFTEDELVALAEPELLEAWQATLIEEVSVLEESTTSSSSLDKALERTRSGDLLDELTTEDLSIEEDWF
jgi:hypothetical protein